MAQARLQFEYEQRNEAGSVTAWSGLPLLVEVMGVFGVREAIRKHVRVFPAPRQFDEENIIMSLVLLLAAGGEYFDDLRAFKNDAALGALLGFALPSPETARQFLYEFHEDSLVEKAAAAAQAAGLKSYVPAENTALRSLALVNRELVAQVQGRWPVTTATLDFDATYQESHKREAKQSYLGPGYQPLVATWVEQGLVVFDQFRDGNVAPHHDPLGVVQQGFAALPPGNLKRFMRGDSAMYSLPLMRWLCEQKIEFAVGAHMRADLRETCAQLASERWVHLDTRPDSVLHIAEVAFTPKDWRKRDPALRFIAIRITPNQDELFAEKCEPKYLAVATNREVDPAELVRWYWGKGGTIEHVHDVLKNDLGAGVFPCGRFGSNAAWLRISVLTHNLLRVVRAIGPEELRTARPKRLRLHLFAIPALLKRHARQVVAWVSSLATGLLTTRIALWGLPLRQTP